MENIYFVVDIDRCWGCKSCQTACLIEHGLKAETTAPPVEAFRLEQDGEPVRCTFVPMLCMHCHHPECVAVCPRGAIEKQPEGIVLIDPERCVGCGLCVGACPYHAVGLESTLTGKKAVKCDLCVERRARGFLTSCEQHCLGEAFTSGGEAVRDALINSHKYSWSVGRVVYVSDVLEDLGKNI